MIKASLLKYPLQLLPWFLFTITAAGQQSRPLGYDSSYYISYVDLITTRLDLTQKYVALTVNGRDKAGNLHYRPNTNLNLGAGFSYEWLTVNLAFGFPFLNKGDNDKGKTNYLDLQTHVYARKYIIDLLGEFYHGYYLYPQGLASGNGSDWYQRPDMKATHLGIAAYRVLNSGKFSYRAALQQNEWQKKSAGSLLIGAEVYYGQNKGDSSIIPSLITDKYDQRGVTSYRYFNIGPGIGYTYTLVIATHFFVNGGATVSLPLSWLQESGNNQSRSSWTFSPGLSFKTAIGYNSPRWGVSALWLNNAMEAGGLPGTYNMHTALARFNVIYRIAPGNKLRKKLRFMKIIPFQ